MLYIEEHGRSTALFMEIINTFNALKDIHSLQGRDICES